MTIDRSSFAAEGFLHLPDLVGATAANRLMSVIYRQYRKLAGDGELDRLSEPWSDPDFDRKMIALRNRDRQSFGALYDATQNSIEAARLSLSSAVVDACASMLDVRGEQLACSGLLCRMDAPGDERNALEWHQDSAYFRHNFSGDHGLVVTLLLSDTTEAHGAVVMAAGSHKEGFRAPQEISKADQQATRQLRLDQTSAASFPQIAATGKKGDGYLLHMDTIHRSGTNVSDRMRYSLIVRYHRMDADDYVPFRTSNKRNDYVWTAVEQRARAARQ